VGAAAAGLPAPLAACVLLMKRYRAMQAQIVVYTDSIGGVTLNQTLSDARAQAVDEALTAAGVAIDRLQYRGAGAATMVADNQTPQGRIENRRAEIEFRPVPAAAP
jgi:outer membrane protein OmpA-like peptidoglycan-associated protein